MTPLVEEAWGRVSLLSTARSGMVEKVIVCLLERCTRIKSQQVFPAPAGSLEMGWRVVRTHGWIVTRPACAAFGADLSAAHSYLSACVPETLQTAHDRERPFFVDRDAEQLVPFPHGPVVGVTVSRDMQHGVPPCRWDSS